MEQRICFGAQLCCDAKKYMYMETSSNRKGQKEHMLLLTVVNNGINL